MKFLSISLLLLGLSNSARAEFILEPSLSLEKSTGTMTLLPVGSSAYSATDSSEIGGYGYGGKLGMSIGNFMWGAEAFVMKNTETRGKVTGELKRDTTAVFGILGYTHNGFRFTAGYAPSVTGHTEVTLGNQIPITGNAIKISVAKAETRWVGGQVDGFIYTFNSDPTTDIGKTYSAYGSYGIYGSLVFPLMGNTLPARK